MEAIIGLVVLAFGFAFVRWLLGAIFTTARAAAKTAVGKGSFNENMELGFKGMGPMEARLVDARFGDVADGPKYKALEIKGLFPVPSSRRVGFVISVFDKVGENLEPVFGLMDVFQEPHSIVYQHSTEVGRVSSDQGFGRWARVGAVVTDLMVPPYAGYRNLSVVVRLVDLDNPPDISLGRHDQSGTIFWTNFLELPHKFEGKGYLEAEEHRDEARALSIQIGMAVAMSDGTFDDTEGEVLRNWIVETISVYPDEHQVKLKDLYNNAMKLAYEKSLAGELSLSELIGKLDEIADKATRYEVIELCFDVMAADGVADATELRVIKNVSEALNLDFDEINRMRDQKMIGLETNVSEQATLEDLLGIESDWDRDRIRKHLRAEFQKLNSRINTLEEGAEREKAQKMLALIADARKKYG